MRSVMVTGAGGFIGCRLVPAAAAESYDILSVARHPVPGRSVLLDLRGSLEKLPSVDWVFHFAGAYVGGNLAVLERRDLRIAENLLDWGRRSGVSNWVFASAAEVYGICRGVVAEGAPTRPVIPYGAVKLRIERLFTQFAEELPGARVVILRLGEVYGRGGRLILELTKRLERGFCPWFGSGDVPVSFVHVDDVVRSVLAAARQAQQGVSWWNVADDEPITWRRFVEDVALAVGGRRLVALPRLVARGYAASSALLDKARGREPVLTQHVVTLLTTPKALSNERMSRDLQVQLLYPDHRTGLREILGASVPSAA